MTYLLVLINDLLENRRIDDVSNTKEVYSMLPCVSSVIDHRGRQMW